MPSTKSKAKLKDGEKIAKKNKAILVAALFSFFLCACCCCSSSLAWVWQTDPTPTENTAEITDQPTEEVLGQTQEVTLEPTLELTTTVEPTAEPVSTYKVTEIVDGDTLKIDYDGVEERVRLIGLDTPELNQSGGAKECFASEAKNKLKELAEAKEVKIEFDQSQGERDKYNRLLLYIWADDIFINEELIKQGYALEYTYDEAYQYQSQFQTAEDQAEQEELGLWGQACACKQGKVKSSKCIACHKKRITYYNWDCTTYTRKKKVSLCRGKCQSKTTSTSSSSTRQCCKYCVKGKACGDSCISRAYTCHKPPGCACNAY